MVIYLFIGLKHSTLENIRRSISGNVTKYFHILRIVRHVEYSVDRVAQQYGFPIIQPIFSLQRKTQ